MSKPTFTRTELEILRLWKRLIVALGERAERIGKFTTSDTEDEIIRWTRSTRVAMLAPNPLGEAGLAMRLEPQTLKVEMHPFCEGDDPDAFMCTNHSGRLTIACLRLAVRVASALGAEICPKGCKHETYHYCDASGTHCGKHCICACQSCFGERKNPGPADTSIGGGRVLPGSKVVA